MALGTVTEVKGDVFVKDIAGNITKLKVGDVIESGQVIFGAEESASYKVSFTESGREQTFVGMAPQLFDITMISSLADVEDGTVNHSSANPFAQSILTPEELAELVSGDDQKGDNIPDETTAGQEKVKDSESTGDVFDDRTGAMTDVNSDLRKAKFFGTSHDYKQEDIFHRDDVNRLGTTSIENQITTPPIITPPTTTPPIPDPGSSVTPLHGTLNLSGDISVPEGSSASYTLTLTNAPKTPLVVTISVGHITTEDGDLLPRTMTVTIPAGSTSVTFSIDNNNDSVYEGPEDYNVSIVSTSGGNYNDLTIGTSSVTTTINDAQTPPTLSIDNQTINEQDGTMTFTVTLSGETEAPVTFHYGTSDVTATDGADYTGVSGEGTIPAGSLTTTITVPISDDYIADNGETFNVILSNPSDNATIGDGVGVGTILDDTVADPYNNPGSTESDSTDTITIQLFALDGSGNRVAANEVAEGSNPSYIAVAFDKNGVELNLGGTVDVQFIDGSATGNGTDYTSTTQTVTLGVAFNTTTTDDYLADNNETFNVAIVDRTFSDATIYESVVIDTTAVITTIKDNSSPVTPGGEPGGVTPDDTVYVQLIHDDTKNEGNSLSHTVQLVDKDGNPITVAAGETITVTIGYTNGTGLTSADYTATTSVTITAGHSSTTFTNPTLSDAVIEPTESYVATISSVSQSNRTYENIAAYTTANGAAGDAITVTGNIVDGVVPVNDTATVVEGTVTITDTGFSNLLANDQIGTSGTITAFTYKDESNVTQSGTIGTAVNTLYGSLTVNADGTWSYTSDPKETHPAGNGALSETIVYTVTDTNGYSGTANFVVTVSDTVPTAVIDATAYLVEGGNTITSDGSDTAHDNLLTNDTLGADGSIVTSITYINESSVSTTVAVPVGSSGVSVDTLSGLLTVKSDGSWSFTSDPTVNNSLGDVTDTFTYVITDGDGDTSSATKTFSIMDGANPDLAPLDQSVSEVSLGYGVTLTPVTVHESLGIIPGSDAYTAKFTSTQSSLEALALTSGGVALTYTVTDGVITAKAGTTTVFTATLTNPSAANAGYDFKLYSPIDHIQPTHDTLWTLPFDVYVQDSDGDVSDTKTFNVDVIDSVPTNANQTVSLTEDVVGGKIIRLSQDNFESNITLNNGHDGDQSVATNGSINIYDGASIIGTLTNLGDGTVKFIPNPNYSNYSGSSSTFTYTITDNDNDSATATVTLSVTPVADAPTMQANHTVSTYEDSSWDGSAYSGDITKAIGLGLALPTKNDQVDQNSGTGDASERLSILTFSFSGSSDFGTATIGYDTNGDGTLDGTLTTITKNSTFTIDITDVADYHPTGASGTYHLTQAQYESLAIIPADDNATNIILAISTASHEVDDSGAVFGTDIVSSTKTENVTVDVKAVTDPISLSFDNNGGLGTISTTTNSNDTFTYSGTPNEGIGAIDLKALLTNTSGTSIASFGDLDGSELRSYSVSGIPEGTIINLGGTTAVANASGVATVNFSAANDKLEDPSFTMTLPPYYSGTVNAVITLSVHDTDSDSTVTPLSNTQVVHFNIIVAPVANTATLSVQQAVGFEDAGRTHGNDTSTGASTIDAPADGIALHIKTTSSDTDGSETFTVTIKGIPDNGTLYYGDATNGIVTIDQNGVVTGTNTNISVTNTGLDSNGGSGWQVVITNFDNTAPLTFIPPHNSDANYVFNVEAYTVDGTVNSSATTQTLQMNVDVIGVADVAINTTLDTTMVPSVGAFNYATTEQTLGVTGNHFALNSVYSTPASIASYDSDGSESLTIVVSGIDAGFSIEGATFMGGSGEGRQWSFTQAQLADGTVKISTPADFSGTMEFTAKYITTEAEGNSKTSDTVPVAIYVAPYANGTIASATTINEDVKSQVDFGFAPHDSNEVLNEVKINIADVNAHSGDFTLYYGDTATTLAAAVGNGHVTSDVTYYILDATAANNIYALGATDKAGGPYNFEVKYTLSDTETNFGSVDTQTNTIAAYALNVSAVTDIPTVTVGTIADSAGHTVSGAIVTVTDHTTITVPLSVTSHDTDGSESVQYYIITNVPAGVEVQGGSYAGHVGTTDSGVWYVPVSSGGTLGAAGYTKDITFVVNGGSDFQTRDVTITAYTQDGSGAAVENASTQITIVRDDTYPSIGTGGTPATFTLSAQSLDVFEDQPFNLASAFNVTQSGVVASGSFAITITDLPIGATISGYSNSYEAGGKTYYVITGSGNAADANAAMANVTITPPQDVNNHDVTSINAMNLSATLTTYSGSVYNSSDSVVFSEPIYPVTDAMSIAMTGGTITEDPSNAQTFSVTLSNANDGVNTQLIDGKLYLRVTENYTDTSGGETATGVLEDSAGNILTTTSVSGVSGLSDGMYYVIDISSYTMGSTLNFQYLPGENRQGNVTIDAYVLNKEAQEWASYPDNPDIAGTLTDTTTLLSHSSSTITVTAVVDGIDGATIITGSAMEDAFAGGTNIVEIATPILIDPSETVQSAIFDGVPVGFLVYYSTDGGATLTLAQNAGTSATYSGTFDLNGTNVGYNQWVIPLNSGSLPANLYIKAPTNWSGTISDAALKLYISDNGSAVTETINTVNVTINPVSDDVTLNATKTFGNQYSSVALNLNANAVDVDGSEHATVILVAASGSTALSADALFTIHHTDGSESAINATYNSGTWTLNDIGAADLGNIKIYHPSYTGEIDVSVTMTDGTAAAGTTATDTFNLTLASTTSIDTTALGNHADVITGTTGADTIAAGDGSDNIDGGAGTDKIFAGAGNDTIIFDSADAVINGGTGIDTLKMMGDVDFSGLTTIIGNIEKIDLTTAGNQTISGLSLDTIFTMTDNSSNHTLTIDGNAGDVVATVDKGSWTLSSDSTNGNYTDHVYTKDGGYTLTLKVETVITDHSGL